MAIPKMMSLGCLLVMLLSFMVEATPPGIANHPAQASCKIKKYKMCYNLVHVCPKFCPDGCEVECASCKPICTSGSSPPSDDTGSTPPVSVPPPSDSSHGDDNNSGGKGDDNNSGGKGDDKNGGKGDDKNGGKGDDKNEGKGKGGGKGGDSPPTLPPYSPPIVDPVPTTPPVYSPPIVDPVPPTPPTYSPPIVDPAPPTPPMYSPPIVDPVPPTPPTYSPPVLPSSPPPTTPSVSPPQTQTPPTPTPTPPSSPPPTPIDTPPTPTTPPSSPSPTPPTASIPPSSPNPTLSPPTTPSTPTPSTPSPTPVTPSPSTPIITPSSDVASQKRVRCRNKGYGSCYGQEFTCPANCPTSCQVDCNSCKPVCSCDYPGAVCQDPRFIGGDGITFYFHGKKDQDFCLVSDPNFHINAHFIGKRNPQMTRDFTWVQSLGILFNNHRLYIGAQKTATWDSTIDRLALSLDNTPIYLPETIDYQWKSSTTPQVTITRTSSTNQVLIHVQGKMTITINVVPITEEESRVHKYDIREDDCFAHLDVGFKFHSLSSSVDGVLGKTYRDDYVSNVKMGASMPIMGGYKEYFTSNIFATDCPISRFDNGGEELSSFERFSSMNCGSGIDGEGVVCKR